MKFGTSRAPENCRFRSGSVRAWDLGDYLRPYGRRLSRVVRSACANRLPNRATQRSDDSFKQSMSRVAARWTRKLEIEARECEHSESASRSKQQSGFDQRENLRRAIAGRKVEIERINRILDNFPPPGSVSRFGQPVRMSQRSIGNLIRRRLEHEAALAELEREEARLAALDGRAGEARGRDQCNLRMLSAPVPDAPDIGGQRELSNTL